MSLCCCIGLVIVASETTTQHSRAQSLTNVASSDPRDIEAQQALARAEALHADWTAASLHQAIDHYEKAAQLWTSISDFPKASEATLKAGDVYRLLSEYPQATKRYQNAEALAQKAGDWLVQATALSHMGRLQSYLGNNDHAQKQLIQALDVFKRHEDDRTVSGTNAYGAALSNLAEVSYAKGDFLKASQQLESALKIFQNDLQDEARARLLKGYLAGSIGVTDHAFAEISRALELYRETNDKSGEGLALSAMGLWHTWNEDQHHAIEMNDKAREIFRKIGDSRSEGIALNAIGQAYQQLGEYPSALSNYKNALALFENIGTTDAASAATYGIASTEHLSGKLDQALASYEGCLRLSRSAGNRRIEAYALEGIAKIYGAQRRPALALIQYQKLERFFKDIGDSRGQAMALNSHGNLFLQLGEKQKSLNLFSRAFSLSETMGDKGILIDTLYNLARTNEMLGKHENALSLIQNSFNLIEEIRSNVASPDFRASYFSAVKRHYDLCIEILMQLHQLRPGEGFAAKAFLVSEQSRARLLLDLLSESRANIRADADKDLVENERTLRGLLRAQAEYQLDLTLSGKDSTALTEVTAQIARLRTEYQTVQAQLREKNPRLFAFEKFAPVDLERVQKQLRGTDTMLLEYALGDDHSYLWALTSDSSDSYVLPARKDIEDAARELYKVITARQGNDGQSEKEYEANIAAADDVYLEKAGNLSRMLLGPVTEKLESRKLIVVADGALQYIPFDALPPPVAQANGSIDASTRFLVATNEVSTLPSASTLIAIRGAQHHKGSPDKLIAIIADPVFSSEDSRVQHSPATPATYQAGQYSRQDEQQTLKNFRLARLAHASDEADAIAAVAPVGATLVAKDFDATRETAMGSEFSRAQIVHFATHGFLDSEHPEVSGIVLTMTDPNGAKTNGLMSLPDIYSLDLSAELTVLSACQTALGKEINGEGLVGLTHSFMSAGAKSVVASLWKIDDRATEALMAEFYKGMLEQNMTPAAALRSAKLKIGSEKQWSAPYYWAGFVLQGEYTNRIAVDRTSWLRPGLMFLFLLIPIAAAFLVFQRRRRRRRPAQFT